MVFNRVSDKGKGDGKQSGEGGELGETPVARNKETVERSREVQKCMERMCSFPPFVCLCLDTLPL